MANKSIMDVSINHRGKLVYIIFPILVMWNVSANFPSHKCEVTKDSSLLYKL